MPAPRILIAGSGRQSVAAGYDLLRNLPGIQLILADFDRVQAESAAAKLLALHPRASVHVEQADVTDPNAIATLAEGCDAVLAGVPYHLNPKVHVAARMASVPSLDMGSDLPDLVAALGPREGPHETLCVFDSGVAPGLGNQLARHLAHSMKGCKGVKILCGGLPLQPRTPLKYRPRFSLEGLIGEYSDPAVALVGGQVAELDSLEDLETVEVPELGTMEAFVTSGGASIGPLLFAGKLESYSYKTLRFPGHCATMRAYRDLGLWSREPLDGLVPFQIFEKLFLAETAKEDERDQVLLLVEAWSDRERKRLFVRAVHDEATGLSAMEQLTGFSAAIVLQHMLADPPAPGLYAAEEIVSGETMIAELPRRGTEVLVLPR